MIKKLQKIKFFVIYLSFLNIAPLQNGHIFCWQVQHIADKLTSDFWIAKDFLSNQVIGWADARMSENHPFPPSIIPYFKI